MSDPQYPPRNPAIVALLQNLAAGLERTYQQTVEQVARQNATARKFAELGEPVELEDLGPALAQQRAHLDELHRSIEAMVSE